MIMSGYDNIRYDYENSPVPSSTSDYLQFDFDPLTVDGDMFASVYLYEDMVVPSSCWTQYPLIDLEVWKNGTRLGYVYYYFQFSKHYTILSSVQSANASYTAKVNIQWHSTTMPTDFSLKLYSKHSSNMSLKLKTTNTNVVTNYDGTTPSSFTCSDYAGMGNCTVG